MIRRAALTLVGLGIGLGISSGIAVAQPSAAAPKAGDKLELAPARWGTHKWLMGAPSANDAAGKVVIHWFCTPKVEGCVDDLARLVTHRDTGNVYIVAYINANQRQAKAIDPIRESEGVGRGTVATGPAVKKLFKQLGIAKGPWSIVVGIDGKVEAVTTSADPNELDARDKVVKDLAAAIKAYTATSDGPKTGKPGEKMTFKIEVQLASWNKFSTVVPMDFSFTAAKEVVCDTTQPKTKIEGTKLTAQVTCTAPKGSYQARGELRFGYGSLSGGQGLGTETATWSFEVKP